MYILLVGHILYKESNIKAGLVTLRVSSYNKLSRLKLTEATIVKSHRIIRLLYKC